MFKKTALFVGVLTLAAAGFVACGGGSNRACASPMYETVLYKGASGGGFSGGSSGGRSSGYSGGSSSKAPSNSGARTSGGTSSGSPTKAPSNSGAGKSTPPANSGVRTSSAVPSKISGNSYTAHSNGVTHVYVYHPASFWVHQGPPDPLNPFDARNFYNPLSPYYHHHINC